MKLSFQKKGCFVSLQVHKQLKNNIPMYEESESGRCPYCGSEDVEEYDNEHGECYSCGEKW